MEGAKLYIGRVKRTKGGCRLYLSGKNPKCRPSLCASDLIQRLLAAKLGLKFICLQKAVVQKRESAMFEVGHASFVCTILFGYETFSGRQMGEILYVRGLC